MGVVGLPGRCDGGGSAELGLGVAITRELEIIYELFEVEKQIVGCCCYFPPLFLEIGWVIALEKRVQS